MDASRKWRQNMFLPPCVKIEYGLKTGSPQARRVGQKPNKNSKSQNRFLTMWYTRHRGDTLYPLVTSGTK